MIATNIEQSRRLIAAGVPMDSADMCWYKAANGLFFLAVRGETPFWEHDAWSLSALWQMIHEAGEVYEFSTDIQPEELIETLVTTICSHYAPAPSEQ